MRMLITCSAIALAACQASEGTNEAAEESTAAPAESDIVLGNGDNNAIAVDGITRAGSVFTVPEVTIGQNGFLVMHPFRDGEPVRDEYVGSTALTAGVNEKVAVDVGEAPEEGDMFIIMLHADMNTDGVFDFGNGQDNVPDAPVFEGEMLIAHAIAAPADSGS